MDMKMKSRRIETFGVREAEAYRIVAEYKWKGGYMCSNCGCKESFEGKFPYSRRCMKCKKDHSPTSGTVFHGVRFPLHIALYIVRDIVKHKDRVGSEQLTERISAAFQKDFRQKTVWAFVMKVFKSLETQRHEFKAYLSLVNFISNSKRIVFAIGISDNRTTCSAIVTGVSEDLFTSTLKHYKSKDIMLSAYNATFRNIIEREFGVKKLRTSVHLTSVVEDTQSMKQALNNQVIEVYKHIAGLSATNYQAHLNFFCFKANGGGYDDLMNIFTRTKAGSISTR